MGDFALTEFETAQLGYVHKQAISKGAYAKILSKRDFDDAYHEITSWHGYQPTPLYHLDGLAEEIEVADILYKDEGPRFGLASFKALGGAYAAIRVLKREIEKQTGTVVSMADIRNGHYQEQCRAITLVSATDGNHGRSLSWGAQRYGAPCRIYIHAEVSEGRAEIMRGFGADVVRIKGDYDESVRLAKQEAEANGWHVVSDTSWEGYSEPPRDVMAGYGVMVSEINYEVEQAPTHVFLQGGVGGLAAGVAAALRHYWQGASPRVVIVEPELAACLYQSAKGGAPVTVDIETETIMAGLSCGEPSEMAWEVLAEEAGDYVTIPDNLVAPMVRMLACPAGTDTPLQAGESAVAGLCALVAARKDEALSHKLGLDGQSRVLIIGSEGITDQDIYDQIMRGAL